MVGKDGGHVGRGLHGGVSRRANATAPTGFAPAKHWGCRELPLVSGAPASSRRPPTPEAAEWRKGPEAKSSVGPPTAKAPAAARLRRWLPVIISPSRCAVFRVGKPRLDRFARGPGPAER